MSDLPEFLLARYAEDEAVARESQQATRDEARRAGRPDPDLGALQSDLEVDSEHGFVGVDASRVLAECDSKRRIVALHRPPIREPETDGELHARSAHPAWEYATTEGPRKQWDDADVPPDGEDWERNLDAGRDGWERFDYTEESYWRRPRPIGPRPAVEPLTLRLLALPYADHPDYREEWKP